MSGNSISPNHLPCVLKKMKKIKKTLPHLISKSTLSQRKITEKKINAEYNFSFQ